MLRHLQSPTSILNLPIFYHSLIHLLHYHFSVHLLFDPLINGIYLLASSCFLSLLAKGVRTYLELRSFIEETIRSFEAADNVDPELHAKSIAEQLARLPQITTY